jgi:hypothetical protein
LALQADILMSSFDEARALLQTTDRLSGTIPYTTHGTLRFD